jgi:hypothetical protein
MVKSILKTQNQKQIIIITQKTIEPKPWRSPIVFKVLSKTALLLDDSMSSEPGLNTHCLGLTNFYFLNFLWSFIRHVSSYQKNLGCSHFFYTIFQKMYHFFKNWKFRFRWKFEFLKFLLSFMNLITKHKTVSYVKLSTSAIGKIIF